MVFLGVPAGGRTPARGCGGAERAQEPHGTRGCSVGRDSAAQGLLAGLAFGFLPRGNESRRHCAPAAGGDAAAIRLQLAEREQALLLAQETVQVSPGAALCASQPPPLCTVAVCSVPSASRAPLLVAAPGTCRAGGGLAGVQMANVLLAVGRAAFPFNPFLLAVPCIPDTCPHHLCESPLPVLPCKPHSGGGGDALLGVGAGIEAPNLMAARGSGGGGFPYG